MERQYVRVRLSPVRYRGILLALSSVVLAGALVGMLTACDAATADAGTNNRHFPAVGHKGYVTCGDPGQPTCPPMPNMWVHLHSTAPADIIAAIESAPDYIAPPEAGDFPASTPYRFDTPVLVLAATTGTGMPSQDLPHFVIRVFVNGVRTMTYDVLYDPNHQRVRMDSIGMQQSPNDPNYGKPFPWYSVSADVAVSLLRSARGVALRPGAAPQLVYFDLDPRDGPQSPTPWTGGGENDGTPIWRLQGADCNLYFVGIDSHVYTASQLPIAPGALLVQP